MCIFVYLEAYFVNLLGKDLERCTGYAMEGHSDKKEMLISFGHSNVGSSRLGDVIETGESAMLVAQPTTAQWIFIFVMQLLLPC